MPLVNGCMRKLIVYLLLVFVAIGIAGTYGMLHNQISYTVSPEYFTKFKFDQFHLLNENIPERIRASTVGFMASWWMGFPIGLIAGLAGFIQKGPRQMLRISIEAMLVAVLFTLLFGLCGLAYGFYETKGVGALFPIYVPKGLNIQDDSYAPDICTIRHISVECSLFPWRGHTRSFGGLGKGTCVRVNRILSPTATNI